MIYFLSVICVLALSIGQIIFKLSAIESKINGSFFTFKFFYLVSAAFFIYGLATFLWIYILRNVLLIKAYPFIGLTFILVPLFSSVILKEIVNYNVFIGGIFILIGVGISCL